MSHNLEKTRETSFTGSSIPKKSICTSITNSPENSTKPVKRKIHPKFGFKKLKKKMKKNFLLVVPTLCSLFVFLIVCVCEHS